MKYDLIIRPEAEQDMQGAFGWYEDRVSGLGKEFLHCINAAIAQISRSPVTHPIKYQDIHRILTRVLAVLHARRDPSMWQKRKGEQPLTIIFAIV